MPFTLSFVLTYRRTEGLAVPGLLKAACQDELGDGMEWDWHVLHIGIACSHVFVSFFKDVNLKMPRNNQLLHFAFREDKQWKLQQVLLTFDVYPSVASAPSKR